jgi:transposase
LALFVADVFASVPRKDQRAKGDCYLRGLMLDGRRKSIQPMAERLPDGNEQNLQQFVNQSTWDPLPERRRIAERMLPRIGPDAWAVDDVSFPKDGKMSVAVAPQYCGALGKQANCQVAVGVHAVSDTASCPLQWRLFVPEEWAHDAARRQKTGIPPEVGHREKWRPRALVWDNEAAIGRRREGRAVLGQEFAALAGLLACKVILCRPRDPEAKGLVERANGYLETSFLPGRVFSSPADFNTQLAGWLEVANRRVHRTLQARPAERWEADRAAMLPLPPTAPPRWWQTSVRIGRDHYIRLDTCEYSVDPAAIGRIVRIEADTETVRAHLDGLLVAEHARCWARHQTLTDPDHAEAATAMRSGAPPACLPAPPRRAVAGWVLPSWGIDWRTRSHRPPAKQHARAPPTAPSTTALGVLAWT